MIRYDLHLHSCLSPCGDDAMTPASVAGLARLEGLDLIALTDHNTSENCPAFLRAAEAYGILAIPGMELTTSEDIHVLCLFPCLERALAFSSYVALHRPAIQNRPEIFGYQRILNEDDEETGQIENLLITASDIGINDAAGIVAAHGGVALPAHIDKDANSVLATLGAIPPEAGFTAVELSKRGDLSLVPPGMSWLRDSDAHYPDAIASAGGTLPFDPDDPPEEIIAALFRYLKGV